MSNISCEANREQFIQFVGALGGKNNCLRQHETLEVGLPNSLAHMKLADAIDNLLNSPLVHDKRYLSFSRARKSKGITYCGAATYSNERDVSGKFYAMCYFPEVSELDFIIDESMVPEELWRRDTDSLLEELSVYGKRKSIDLIYRTKKGKVGIDYAESRSVLGKDKSVDGVWVGDLDAYIRVSDFLAWYDNGGKDIVTGQLWAQKVKQFPAMESLNEIVRDIERVAKNHSLGIDKYAVIFRASWTSSGFGWCFGDSTVEIGDSFTLANGNEEVVILHKVSIDNLTSRRQQ